MERRARVRQIGGYAVLIAACALLQVFWPRNWLLLGARPDFTLVLSVLSGFLFGVGDGIAIGLAAGYVRDALAGRGFGMGMLLLMYAGICGAILFRRRFRRQFFFALALVGVATVLYQAVILGLDYFFPMIPDITPSGHTLILSTLRVGGGALALNLAAAALMFQLLLHAGPYRKDYLEGDNSEVLTGDHIW